MFSKGMNRNEIGLSIQDASRCIMAAEAQRSTNMIYDSIAGFAGDRRGHRRRRRTKVAGAATPPSRRPCSIPTRQPLDPAPRVAEATARSIELPRRERATRSDPVFDKEMYQIESAV